MTQRVANRAGKRALAFAGLVACPAVMGGLAYFVALQYRPHASAIAAPPHVAVLAPFTPLPITPTPTDPGPMPLWTPQAEFTPEQKPTPLPSETVEATQSASPPPALWRPTPTPQADLPLPPARPAELSVIEETPTPPRRPGALWPQTGDFSLRDLSMRFPHYDQFTAIYDVSAHTVYLPNGERLEAHSGLGELRDDPRFVEAKDRGPTPPHFYDLTLREDLFHGVQALRLNPEGGADAIFGRDGLLAHTYMLGPGGDSNGCVSFKNYDAFLQAYQAGLVKHLAVVSSLR